MAGTGAPLRFGDRHAPAQAAVEGASDAALQTQLGRTRFWPWRFQISRISQTLDRRVAQETWSLDRIGGPMSRKLASGEYRLYSHKKNPKTGKRRNLGTFKTLAAAQKHERDVQYFKRH